MSSGFSCFCSQLSLSSGCFVVNICTFLHWGFQCDGGGWVQFTRLSHLPSHTHLLSKGLILINFFTQAMAEEKKRYCLVLDRTSIVAKSTMEYCEHVSISCLKCGGMQSVLPHLQCMFFTASYNFCSLSMSTMVEYGINWTFVMLWTGLYSTYDEISFKIEYIRKLSNFNFHWTKIL